MKLLVNLTEEHIKNARKQTKCDCPLALAIRQAYREATKDHSQPHLIPVDFTSVDMEGGRIFPSLGASRHLAFTLPEEARKSVSLFDAGKKIKPIQFEIEATEADTVKCSTDGSLDTELLRRCRE